MVVLFWTILYTSRLQRHSFRAQRATENSMLQAEKVGTGALEKSSLYRLPGVVEAHMFCREVLLLVVVAMVVEGSSLFQCQWRGWHWQGFGKQHHDGLLCAWLGVCSYKPYSIWSCRIGR
jgi:hypothetical protein